jgi:hypothetical protein
MKDSFEKARFEYCKEIFEREELRKENLEKKAQFYLSFVTLFLGAVFLKVEYLSDIRDIISQASQVTTIILVSLILLGLSLLAAIITVLMSVRVRGYQAEYPEDFAEALHSVSKGYIEKMDEATLLNQTALSYAIAVEANRKINGKKAWWVKLSMYCIFVAVISLALLILAIFLS